MKSETMASLLLLLAKAVLGFVTLKAAEMSGAKGSPVLWFIGGAIIPMVALPSALLKLDPRRKLDRVLLRPIDLDLNSYRICAEFVRKVALKLYPIVSNLQSRLTVLKT